MKKILVTQRVVVLPERDERRDTLDQNMVKFLSLLKGIVLPVPNCLIATEQLDTWLMSINADAIILSGGDDLGKTPERDKTEFHLLSYAKEYNTPVLGICRGMQMMAAYEGVGVKRVAGHAQTVHSLNGEIRREVNSYHDFSIECCPETYRCIAYSEDSQIEAIKHKRRPWEGWMWHPERSKTFSISDLERLQALIE